MKSPTARALIANSDAQKIATFTTPDRIYQRILRDPLAIRLLSLGRSDFRLRALERRAHGTRSTS